MKVLFNLVIIFGVFSLSLAQDNDGRIVNGQDADVRDFPHVLALYDQGRYKAFKSCINQA
jgi:secreted trypsin-like serine protease